HKPYKIQSITFPQDSSMVSQAVTRTQKNTLLKVGDPFDLDIIKTERERIDASLKEEGFYFFNPDFLLVQVDSTVGNYKVDLLLKVKRDTPEQALKVFTINKIVIYPDHNLRQLRR